MQLPKDKARRAKMARAAAALLKLPAKDRAKALNKESMRRQKEARTTKA